MIEANTLWEGLSGPCAPDPGCARSGHVEGHRGSLPTPPPAVGALRGRWRRLGVHQEAQQEPAA
jgi:hypothetical protein